MSVFVEGTKDPSIDNDPTRHAVNRPWKPLTPEQLDTFRPTPVVASAVTPAQEAKNIAYQSGVSALEGIVLRLQALEREVAELKIKGPA